MSRFLNRLFFYSITLWLFYCRQNNKNEIYLNYFYTAETVYTKIEIKNKKLYHTYFEPDSNDCKQWVAQVPCWNVNDLKTDSMTLNDINYEKLVVLIDTLIETDKKHPITILPHPENRHYTYQLEIKKENYNKQLQWYSYPGNIPTVKELDNIVDFINKVYL